MSAALAKFIIGFGVILAAGPLENEGGREAVQDKGVKAAATQAIEEADASTLRGNYGNE